MLIGSGLIFAITSAVLVAAFVPALRPMLQPRRLMLWGGLVVPTVILTVLVIAAFILGERLLVHRADATIPRIEVVSQQFAWRFRYPGHEGSTQGTLHIRAGEPVEFMVTSEDVIHSFWVPRLGGKIDAIPGHRNLVSLQADRPGTYGGICAEYCGEGHPLMTFEVIAHAPEDYEAALAAELVP
jgi:cytochrome c oxidase subunit II